ncbi:hypothetical protein JTE90_006658 [Oedothorax gibbosus]|uniref:Uncharacterized protein n=1 Tax=Oedothorax gibbosus TaxID=931172 RepID=A0AAV6TSJ5_9ARAC|nr:hypothetical protein JTE90_006658 [Oedothorax gibbosus]
MLLSSSPSQTANNAPTNCKTSIKRFDSFTETRSCCTTTKADTVYNDDVRVSGEMKDNHKVDKCVEVTECKEPTPLVNSIIHSSGLNKIDDCGEPNGKYVTVREDYLKGVVAVAYEYKSFRNFLHVTIRNFPAMQSVKDIQDSLDKDEKQYEENKYSVNNTSAPLSTIHFGEGRTELQLQQQEKDHATERLLDNTNEPLTIFSFG